MNSIKYTYDNLKELLAKPNSYWDSCHNFIQFLFPTTKPSQYNPEAPILTISDVEFLSSNIAKVLTAVERFKSFMVETKAFSSFNHNFLRISRIIQFLREIGESKESEKFYAWAISKYTGGDSKALEFWQNSLNSPSLISK